MSAVKLFNDPVHGFIEVPQGPIRQLIDHQWLQRLRRVSQLGLSSFVYPGAVHSRFSHTLGAYHLTGQALNTLRAKGIAISDEEYEAARLAILLHDIGHAPFSHALEHLLVPGIHHEQVGRALMTRLNAEMQGALSLAIRLFDGTYPRRFLCQLISSQLDMDRMDYLVRDSFFTGVQEGIVGTERLIKTLNVADEQLVVEQKGIYSAEKFVVARRLMYWQVYLHKTALAAECMLMGIMKRARVLYRQGDLPHTGPALAFFLGLTAGEQPTPLTDELIHHFVQMDDADILYHIKQWQHVSDPVLSGLCSGLLARRLFKIRLQHMPVSVQQHDYAVSLAAHQMELATEAAAYFVVSDKISNLAYARRVQQKEPILILMKDGRLKDLAEASDLPMISSIAETVNKYYLCAPAGVMTLLDKA
ncbi:MAG: HD domain-containing protein [Bacteroidetes bacterium]|nr:HD domain-containing protein [Bacteroidota bacterium]